MSHNCPLCQSDAQPLLEAGKRSFFQCGTCSLIFVDPSQHLSLEQQKEVYDQHENDPLDIAYQRFLNRLVEPMLHHLIRGQVGLDYGSGPGPTLSIMMKGKGLDCDIFDPIYAAEVTLRDQYDFITSTEVFEHFTDPKKEFEFLDSKLEPGGLLGVMTSFAPAKEEFADWHYHRDPTHIVFYTQETFEWIAENYNYHPQFHGDSVVLLTKL